MCWLEGHPREIFTGHNFGEQSCISISDKDRRVMNEANKLSNIQESEDIEYDEDELAEMHGYSGHHAQEAGEEVKINSSDNIDSTADCNSAQIPKPSQILHWQTCVCDDN